ncbi:uncharacterized protein EI90DRAFT_3037941, partial [Cantharellus anzutake]|uniref:uncharacterized protein n=1 Tax=Cantharellus anzutake TaxID=1750568 RepID=UPI001906DD0D
MFLPFTSFVAFLASAVLAQQLDPSINTPVGVTQCAVSLLTWYGTHPPFTISAIPGGQPGSAPIEDIITSSDQSYSWLCNLAQGTYITLQIRDTQGNLQYSSPITVQNSGNSSCVGQSPSSTPGGSSTAGGSSTSGGSSTPGGTSTSGERSTTTGLSTTVLTTGSTSSTGTGSHGSSTTSKASSATSPSPSTSTSSRGAAMPTAAAQWGVAGALGFIGAAVLA